MLNGMLGMKVVWLLFFSPLFTRGELPERLPQSEASTKWPSRSGSRRDPAATSTVPSYSAEGALAVHHIPRIVPIAASSAASYSAEGTPPVYQGPRSVLAALGWTVKYFKEHTPLKGSPASSRRLLWTAFGSAFGRVKELERELRGSVASESNPGPTREAEKQTNHSVTNSNERQTEESSKQSPEGSDKSTAYGENSTKGSDGSDASRSEGSDGEHRVEDTSDHVGLISTGAALHPGAVSTISGGGSRADEGSILAADGTLASHTRGRGSEGGGRDRLAQCVKPAYEMEGVASQWYTMKRIPPPAQCTVQGLVIEELEPQYNFRRAWTLRYLRGGGELEDKTHLLPYLRAVQDRSLGTRRRRVLLDLGGAKFESSTLWFLQFYPLDFTEIHDFEGRKGVFVKPLSNPSKDPSNFPDLLDKLTNKSAIPSRGAFPLPSDVLDRITVHEQYVSTVDSEGTERRPGRVNITRFILEELRLTASDAVIVKMDIEGMEWDVLPLWIGDPSMPYIVDELFVEVHYHHPSMAWYKWTDQSFKHSRQEAVKLMRDLRAEGFFAHVWP